MAHFPGDKYFARRKVLALAGQVYIYDETQKELLAYVKQKMFTLKEDITVYKDETKGQPIMKIKALHMVDFAAAYEVIDLEKEKKVGLLQRKGFKSMFKDEWLILNKSNEVIARLKEASGLSALASRMISMIPQKYVIEMEGSGEQVAQINQKFGMIAHKFNADFSLDRDEQLDRRLGIAAIILLLIIEGRQE